MPPQGARASADLWDPEPFTIAALIIAALAAAAGIGSFGVNVKRSRTEQERAKREIKNALRHVIASFKKTEQVFHAFVSYLDKFGFKDIDFKVGSRQIAGGKEVVQGFRQMLEDLFDAIRKFNDASIELANLLDERESLKFREGVDRFDGLLKEAFHSKSYGTFISTASRLLDDMRSHLHQVAASYDLKV